MIISENVKRGLKIGIVLGGLLSILSMFNNYYGNNIIYNNTSYNIKASSNYKIAILNKFQKIRDPINNRWLSYSILDRGETIWINRRIEISGYTPEEAVNYYYSYLKNNNIFTEVGIRSKYNIVWFKHNLYNIEGGITIENTQPLKVLIRIGRYG